MKLVTIILISFFILSGCTSYPSKMNLEITKIEIIDYEDIDYFRVNFDQKGLTDISTPTIKFHIKSEAFSYIYEYPNTFQFRCNLKNGLGNLSDVEFGRIYYNDAPNSLGKAPYWIESPPYFSDFYVYSFRSLKASSGIRRYENIDLLKEDFSYIECSLLTSPTMLFGFLASSQKIIITKTQFEEAYESYLKSSKSTDIISLQDYILGVSKE